MTDLSSLKFFVTPAHKCSYLSRNDAITLFADPKQQLDRKIYSDLSAIGFRRSGNYLYRPHCQFCDACIPARIPVADFEPSRQQRRVIRKNQDLKINRIPAAYYVEHYLLYEKYIIHKHADGDMYPPSPQQYESFLFSDWGNTWFYEMHVADKLVAVAVADIMHNGLSAVYTFYDLEESKRSLGVMAILWQIEQAKILGLPAVYLGYWIENCDKMSYKSHYQPLEIFRNNKWIRLRQAAPEAPIAATNLNAPEASESLMSANHRDKIPLISI